MRHSGVGQTQLVKLLKGNPASTCRLEAELKEPGEKRSSSHENTGKLRACIHCLKRTLASFAIVIVFSAATAIKSASGRFITLPTRFAATGGTPEIFWFL